MNYPNKKRKIFKKMTPLIILSILVLHSLNPTLGVFAENRKEVDDNSLVIENDAPSSGNDEATPIEDAFSSDSEEIEDNTLESDNNMPTDEGTTEDTTLETETDISTEGSATEDSTSETKTDILTDESKTEDSTSETETDILTDESETIESTQEQTEEEDTSANEEKIPLKERNLIFVTQPRDIPRTADISSQKSLQKLVRFEDKTSKSTDEVLSEKAIYRLVHTNDGSEIKQEELDNLDIKDSDILAKLVVEIPVGDGYKEVKVTSKEFRIQPIQIFRIPDSQDSNVTTNEENWTRVEKISDIQPYDVIRGFLVEDMMVIKKDENDNLLVSSLKHAGIGAFVEPSERTTFYKNDKDDDGYNTSNLKKMIDNWYQTKVAGTDAEDYVLPVEVKTPTLEEVLQNDYLVGGTGYDYWFFTTYDRWSSGIIYAAKTSVGKDWSTKVLTNGTLNDRQAFALSVQDIPNLGQANGDDWVEGTLGQYYRDNNAFQYKYLANIKNEQGNLDSEYILLRTPGRSFEYIAGISVKRAYVSYFASFVDIDRASAGSLYVNLDGVSVEQPSNKEWIHVKLPTKMFFSVDNALKKNTDENIKSNNQTIENLSERSLNVSFNVDNDFSSVLNVHNIDFLSPDVTPNLGEEAMHLKLNLDKGDTPIYLHNNGGGIDESILFDPKEARTVSLGGAYFGDVPTKEQTAKEVTVQLTLHFEAGNDTGGGGTTPVKEGE